MVQLVDSRPKQRAKACPVTPDFCWFVLDHFPLLTPRKHGECSLATSFKSEALLLQGKAKQELMAKPRKLALRQVPEVTAGSSPI